MCFFFGTVSLTVHLPGEGWSEDADPHGAEVYRGGAQSVQTGTSSLKKNKKKRLLPFI